MRQTIARAADGVSAGGSRAGAWPGWMAPAPAMAAVAIAVVALGAVWIGRFADLEPPEFAASGAPPSETTPAPNDPGTSASTPIPPAPEPTPALAGLAEETAPRAARAPELVAADDPADNAADNSIDNPAENISPNPSPPDKRARTVQFTAPRGTRIIWTLDPNFEPPIAGRAPRQEP
jgi:hypothetical protein